MDDTPIADPTANGAEATETAPIENEVAVKDETKEGDLAEMIEDAEAAATAAGSDEVPAPTAEENKDTPADIKDEVSEEKEESKEDTVESKEGASEEGEAAVAMAVDKAEPSTETETPKETKKRVRRVGRTPTRKIAKLEEKIPPVTPVVEGGETNNLEVAAAAVDAATVAIGAVPETPTAMESTAPAIMVPQQPANQGVLSKHDEKWHAMFQKLMEYKERNKHTLVPQCYTEDPR